MSGPFYTATDVGCIGGAQINHTGLPINGFAGSANLYVDPFLDEEMFILLISGRLNVKEKVCAVGRTRRDKALAGAKYKAVCSKVKP
jgi:hypothetical protein